MTPHAIPVRRACHIRAGHPDTSRNPERACQRAGRGPDTGPRTPLATRYMPRHRTEQPLRRYPRVWLTRVGGPQCGQPRLASLFAPCAPPRPDRIIDSPMHSQECKTTRDGYTAPLSRTLPRPVQPFTSTVAGATTRVGLSLPDRSSSSTFASSWYSASVLTFHGSKLLPVAMLRATSRAVIIE